jgi:hypothetical protein
MVTKQKHMADRMVKRNLYTFYIVTNAGEVLIWEDLTRYCAFSMFNATHTRMPDGVAECNWGAQPDPNKAKTRKPRPGDPDYRSPTAYAKFSTKKRKTPRDNSLD